MGYVSSMDTKSLYRWVEDQIADFGDKGVAWQNIVSFGVTIAGIEAARLDCAIADLINARRLAVRQRDNMLVYRD